LLPGYAVNSMPEWEKQIWSSDDVMMRATLISLFLLPWKKSEDLIIE
jgi:hypothetical protein